MSSGGKPAILTLTDFVPPRDQQKPTTTVTEIVRRSLYGAAEEVTVKEMWDIKGTLWFTIKDKQENYRLHLWDPSSGPVGQEGDVGSLGKHPTPAVTLVRSGGKDYVVTGNTSGITRYNLDGKVDQPYRGFQTLAKVVGAVVGYRRNLYVSACDPTQGVLFIGELALKESSYWTTVNTMNTPKPKDTWGKSWWERLPTARLVLWNRRVVCLFNGTLRVVPPKPNQHDLVPPDIINAESLNDFLGWRFYHFLPESDNRLVIQTTTGIGFLEMVEQQQL